jgi:quinol monooxygenase YgiN
LSIHFIVRFEPLPGRELAFQEELERVAGPTREELGCLEFRAFASIREPLTFAVHSEWEDEAAFELHASLPHTVKFINAAKELLAHPIEGLRAREIARELA